MVHVSVRIPTENNEISCLFTQVVMDGMQDHHEEYCMKLGIMVLKWTPSQPPASPFIPQVGEFIRMQKRREKYVDLKHPGEEERPYVKGHRQLQVISQKKGQGNKYLPAGVSGWTYLTRARNLISCIYSHRSSLHKWRVGWRGKEKNLKQQNKGTKNSW